MTNWQDHKQFHEADWESWLDMEPDINIGVLTGLPSGIIFIDIDNEEARKEYERLERREGEKDSSSSGGTSSDKSGTRKANHWGFATGNGERVIFLNEDRPCQSYKRSAGSNHYLEILADGRQSVLPPSLHASGRRYRWTPGLTPRDNRGSRAPYWCFERTGEAGTGKGNGSDITSAKRDWKRIIQDGAVEGNRNEALAVLCGHLVAPQPLPEDEVRIWMHAYNQVFCSPPLEERELETIINSIMGREESSFSKIKVLMDKYNVSRSVAEEYMLQGME